MNRITLDRDDVGELRDDVPTRPRARALSVALAIGCVVALLFPAVQLASQITKSEPAAYAFDEDAWYTFNVARNIASGDSITIDGTHLTSGFQPLWTIGLAVPFLLHDHLSAALALVALISFGLWGVGAWLFGDIAVRLRRPGWLRPLDVRLLAALVFLLDQWLRGMYLNGLETGLQITLLLALARYVLLADAPPETRRRQVALGVLLAAVALTRVDGILFDGVALGALVLLHPAWRAVKRFVVPVAVVAISLLPWVAFNLHVSGNLEPQSGPATAVARANGLIPTDTRAREAGNTLALVPYWPATPDPLLTNHSALYSGAIALIAVEVLLVLGSLRPRRNGRWALAVLAVALAGLVAAYVARSYAFWFYFRYFTPLRVVAMLLFLLALARLLELVAERARQAVAIGAIALVAIPVLWVWRREPPRSQVQILGAELISLRKTDAFAGCGPIGMIEAGRTGYAFPTRIVNLDGKVNVDGLHAIENHRFLDYLDEASIRVVYVRSQGVRLEQLYPGFDQRFVSHVDPNDSGALIAVRRGFSCAAAGT